MSFHYAGKFDRPEPDDADETEDGVFSDVVGAPIVLNPEAIGDPDATPVVQLHDGNAPEADQ